MTQHSYGMYHTWFKLWFNINKKERLLLQFVGAMTDDEETLKNEIDFVWNEQEEPKVIT